jgi:hypothetical protein
MSGKVWMSSLMGNHTIFFKPGLRAKQFGEEWAPARHELDVLSDRVLAAHRRHKKGYSLTRTEMTEAVAVFDEKCFARTHDVFSAGSFYAVKARVAEILSRFDLGGGGLIPLPVYDADLATPYSGEFFLLNFGARKNSLLPEECEDARKFIVEKGTGKQIWKINYLKADGEVTLSSSALGGPDFWSEEAVYGKIFMSDALATALIGSGLAEDWQLLPCKIAEAQS